MKQKNKRRIARLFTGIFIFVAAMNPLRAATAHAAAGNVDWNEVSKMLDASEQLVNTLARYGIDMDRLNALPKKDAAFFDKNLDEILSGIQVPEDYVPQPSTQTFAADNGYQAIFEKQMKVIYKAAVENKERGMSKLNYSFENEIIFMFIAHYMDGNGGVEMYRSEYGYQSQNMADWITDEDRTAYKRLMNVLDRNGSLKQVGAFGGAISNANNFVNMITESNNILNTLDFALSTVLPNAVQIMDPNKYDYNELIGNASETLQNSETISEFQEKYFKQLQEQYTNLDDAIITGTITAISAAIYASNPIAGIALTCVYALITLVDLEVSLNNVSLAMSRNFRVSERILDYMEYNGYF